MATTRMRFALPYEPETQLGRAIGAISNAMFGGPTAYQIEAQQAERDAHRATAALKGNELQGRGALGDLIAGYAANPREGIKDFATRLYETAARYGYNPGDAAVLHRGALAGPHASEQDRAFGTYVKDGKINPYDSFGDLGAQRAAEGRETASKTRVATSAAAAANPDKYQRVRLIDEEIKGQPVGSTDRRVIAGLDTKPTATERADAETGRKLGLSETDMAAFRIAQKTAELYKSPLGNGIDYGKFEREHPDLARTHRRVLETVATAQASPNVQGQRKRIAASGQSDWEVPSEMARGQYVPAWRDPGDGQWRKMEADGKVYILRQQDR